jgi:hypothetical protein
MWWEKTFTECHLSQLSGCQRQPQRRPTLSAILINIWVWMLPISPRQRSRHRHYLAAQIHESPVHAKLVNHKLLLKIIDPFSAA